MPTSILSAVTSENKQYSLFILAEAQGKFNTVTFDSNKRHSQSKN